MPRTRPRRDLRTARLSAMDDTPAYLLVLTTCPDADSAEGVARHLVEAGLAACVSVVAGLRSFYRWQGRLESADEHLLIVKTRADRYPAVEQAIRARSSYEVPEVLALPIGAGLAEYLAWLDACVGPGP